MDLPKGWQGVLEHLRMLSEQKAASRHHKKNRHSRQHGGASEIVKTYADCEMKHRRQHKG